MKTVREILDIVHDDTPNPHAVAIAQDALNQLNAGKLIGTKSFYFIPIKGEEEDFDPNYAYNSNAARKFKSQAYGPNGTVEFNKYFRENNDVRCRVCAMGALLISEVNLNNNFNVEDAANASESIYVAEESCESRLDSYFSPYNLRLMEAVFEGKIHYPYKMGEWYTNNLVLSLPEREFVRDRILNYYEKYPDLDDRLRAILLNVIRNKGSFRLPQKRV